MLPLILLLSHLYVGVRLVPALTAWPLLAGLTGLTVAASAIAMLMLWRTHFKRHGGHADNAWVWPGFIAMGWFSSMFVLTLLREPLLLLAHWLASDAAPCTSGSAVGVLALAGLATALGAWNARQPAAVRRVDVPIDGLHPDLHGFTITQISDLHVSPTIRRPYVEAVVAAVNALQADLVVITGDVVDGSVAALTEHTAPLGGLRARHGVYAVTGNHEYYSGANAWVTELRRLGLTVLMNQHVVLQQRDARLVLAGVTDYNADHFEPDQRSDPAAALAQAPQGTLKVLLAHQPRSAAAASAAGFDLQLSGHTHGGQFMPWGWFVPLQQPYVAGLYRHARMWVYVSRGTGYWGPPKRLGAPSEISHIRLVRV
ncbi:MAG: metallophosphoesterase [Leptothrix sp. (in: b-proteobacteria)]